MIETTLEGETVGLHPAPGLVWGETVFVADVHVGKAATFRAHGLGVPGGTTAENLRRLTALVRAVEASRLVVLGDLIHAASGMTADVVDTLRDWLTADGAPETILVPGNHDRRASDVLASLPLTIREAPVQEGPFVWQHVPDAHAAGHVLAGHVHPAARLSYGGRRTERVPCFHITDRVTTLPAFGEFTGTAEVTPAPTDRVFVVAEDAVIEM